MKWALTPWVLMAWCSISANVGSVLGSEFLQYLTEKRHFFLTASRHFEDQMWVDYRGALYFRPNTAEALDITKAIRESRERYVALTNAAERTELRYKTLQDSGISPRYVKHLTTPNDPTNAVPILHGKQLKSLPLYTLLQSLENGDAVIRTKAAEPETLYIYQYARAADERGTEPMLVVPEELKSYPAGIGGSETIMAYTRVDLTAEDKETLKSIRNTCLKYASQLEAAIEELKKQPATPKPPSNLRVIK